MDNKESLRICLRLYGTAFLVVAVISGLFLSPFTKKLIDFFFMYALEHQAVVTLVATVIGFTLIAISYFLQKKLHRKNIQNNKSIEVPLP